jgi:hypothetical protein
MKTFLAALILALGLGATASAQQGALALPNPAPSWEKLKLSEWVNSVKLGGDLRLRLDQIFRRGAAQRDRRRNRFRLRFGLEAAFPYDITAAFRLASGNNGDQVSTNQTYDTLGSKKGIWIDQAYAKWAPPMFSFNENLSAYFASGRMPNNLWRLYSSELVWDDDFSLEGFGQGFELLLPEWRLQIFANAMQTAVNEAEATGTQWVFSEQVGFEFPLPFDTRLKIAGAYHKWSNENRAGMGQVLTADGNRRVGGVLVNHFGVAEVTSQLSGYALDQPVAVQSTLIRNTAGRGDLRDFPAICPANQTCPQARDGYQIGVVVGKALIQNSWEAAYFKKYSETDSTVADVTDSDFGDGGTNRSGHIFWLAYAPADWMLLKAKGSITDVIDTQFNPNDKAVNRWQVDWSIKF